MIFFLLSLRKLGKFEAIVNTKINLTSQMKSWFVKLAVLEIKVGRLGLMQVTGKVLKFSPRTHFLEFSKLHIINSIERMTTIYFHFKCKVESNI